MNIKAFLVSLMFLASAFAQNPADVPSEMQANSSEGGRLQTYDKKQKTWVHCTMSDYNMASNAQNLPEISVGFLSKANAEASTDVRTPSDDAICSRKGMPSTSNRVDPSTLDDDGSVWRVGTNRWSQAEELKFANWVEKNVDKNFMRRNNLATDCADAPTVIRAIYARIHSLPQVYTDGNEKTGHFSKKWAALPTIKTWTETNWEQSLKADRRFREFINYAGADLVSSASLSYNTYPIALFAGSNQKNISQYLHAGTMVVSMEHTRFISKIDPNNALSIRELHSTVPRKVRELEDEILALIPNEKMNYGLINWRWAVNCGADGWMLTPPEKMPGFSTEQYKLPKPLNMNLMIAAKRPEVKATAADINQMADELQDYVQARVDIVLEAEKFIAKNGKNLSPQQDDEFSTFSRDVAISAKATTIRAFRSINATEINVTADKLNQLLSDRIIDVGHGKKTSLFLIELYGLGSMATGSHEKRWHLDVLKEKYVALKNSPQRTPYEQLQLEALKKVLEP